jgi:crossover junction endodeoxyribonuclease RuvC
MVIAGIDPGLDGAIALLDGDRFIRVDDLPIHEVKNGKRVKRSLDLALLREMLVRQPIDCVVIESVHSMPKQGVASMFAFGDVFGSIKGVVAGLQLPCTLVAPQTWQKTAGCGPSPDAARQTAGRLYPAAASYLARKRDAGRADALLIARYGLRLLQTSQPSIAA